MFNKMWFLMNFFAHPTNRLSYRPDRQLEIKLHVPFNSLDERTTLSFVACTWESVPIVFGAMDAKTMTEERVIEPTPLFDIDKKKWSAWIEHKGIGIRDQFLGIRYMKALIVNLDHGCFLNRLIEDHKRLVSGERPYWSLKGAFNVPFYCLLLVKKEYDWSTPKAYFEAGRNLHYASEKAPNRLDAFALACEFASGNLMSLSSPDRAATDERDNSLVYPHAINTFKRSSTDMTVRRLDVFRDSMHHGIAMTLLKWSPTNVAIIIAKDAHELYSRLCSCFIKRVSVDTFSCAVMLDRFQRTKKLVPLQAVWLQGSRIIRYVNFAPFARPLGTQHGANTTMPENPIFTTESIPIVPDTQNDNVLCLSKDDIAKLNILCATNGPGLLVPLIDLLGMHCTESKISKYEVQLGKDLK